MGPDARLPLYELNCLYSSLRHFPCNSVYMVPDWRHNGCPSALYSCPSLPVAGMMNTHHYAQLSDSSFFPKSALCGLMDHTSARSQPRDRATQCFTQGKTQECLIQEDCLLRGKENVPNAGIKCGNQYVGINVVASRHGHLRKEQTWRSLTQS